ncbi:hypothetical protein [Amycolatopsis orientalis]|uniref:hypothetical protein n=1 Tax=Amycolatopsis orientalis TaxID=31958 RepID=UPI0005661BD9|nr:hypothetical protein [Amycolatopsis orientalis]
MFSDPATTDPYAGAVTWDRAGEARIAVLYPPYVPLVRTHLNGLRALVDRRLSDLEAPFADPRLALLVERMREASDVPPAEPEVLADVRTRLDWALSVLPEHGGVLELHTPMHQWWWGRALLDVCTAISALLGAWLRGEAVDGQHCPDDATWWMWMAQMRWLDAQFVEPLKPSGE